MKKPIALVALLAVLWLARPAAAAAPTVVLGSAVLEVAAGQTEPLSVTVADVQDLYGLEIHLRFDPAVVQVADADLGKDGIQVAAGDFLSADFVAQNQADNQAGSIDYAVTQVNPNEPRSGSGTLLVIRFQGGAAGGASPLEVTNGLLTTRDGDLIPVTFANGEVRVKGAAAAAGNATATPTTPANRVAAGDPPTATRATINTPIPAAAAATPSAQPSPAAPGAAVVSPAISPAAVQADLPAAADATQTPQAAAEGAATAAPATAAQAPSTAPPVPRRAFRRRRRASQPRRSWRRRPRATRAKRSWNPGPPSGRRQRPGACACGRAAGLPLAADRGRRADGPRRGCGSGGFLVDVKPQARLRRRILIGRKGRSVLN